MSVRNVACAVMSLGHRVSSVGVFALTNDDEHYETGVTEFNIDLIIQLCRSFTDIQFCLYLSPRNATRFGYIAFPNLEKQVIAVNARNTGFLARLSSKILGDALGLQRFSIHNSLYQQVAAHRRHDVYLYTVFGLFQGFPAYLARENKGYCISFIHDVRFERPTRMFDLRARLRQWIDQRSFSRLVQSSRFVVVPSSAVRETVCAFEAREKVRLGFCVPYLEDLDGEGKSDVLQKSGLPGNFPRKFLFFPATIVDTKRHIDLIRAMVALRALNPDIHLVLCGSNWSSELGERLRREISELGLSSCIHHLGFVSGRVKLELYRRAVALVVPSSGESFNLAIWEAFGLGCVVTCSNDRELQEQVGDAGAVFEVGDSSSLVRVLGSVIRDPELRNHYAERGRLRYQRARASSLLSDWAPEAFEITTQ